MIALCAWMLLQASDVFVSGAEGFDTYRIPAVARASNGDLLAFAEARASVSDQAGNRLVLKRRPRGSAAWLPIQVVASIDGSSLNNPCLLTLPRGRVLLMFQQYPNGVSERNAEPGFDGPRVVKSFLMESRDSGRTWRAMRDVSRQVKRDSTIRTVCSGPGIGIQVQSRQHKGRLVFPFNERDGREWRVFAAYSDDNGQTWNAGATAPQPQGENGNEVQMVEVGSGRLLLNARNQGKTHARLQSVSNDGGETWEQLKPVSELIDPICMGSIVRLGRLLVLSNPADSRTRVNGTISVSSDGGASWSARYRFPEASFAYSCLVPLGGQRVGCLYETVGALPGGKEHYTLRFREIDLAASK